MKKSFEKKMVRIFAFAMAIMIFAMTFNSSAISVYASNNTTVGKGGSLYGTGSANELNIVKLLDMALNRGGMSMSPATIKQFLEFWWDSVKSDLNTCIGNVDTSIEGTQAFVDALNAALVSAEHYDKLGDIIKKYISFCMTLEYKSLSDFKQLLTQENTFRQFLLSYVSDEDGNIVGTVDNKLKKYNLKSGLVNMVRKAADAYIEEYEGYYLFKTKTLTDISPTFFQHKAAYDASCDILRSVNDDTILFLSYYSYSNKFYYFADVSKTYLVRYGNGIPSSAIQISAYDYSWSAFNLSVRTLEFNSKWELINDTFTQRASNSSFTYYPFRDLYSDNSAYAGWVFTSDGRSVKIWKSIDEMKKYSVGKSDIYYSTQYSGFDYEVDNSVTFDYDYYTSNNYSHTVIQNNIDNSTEVNETVINNIVNNYITNNYYGGGSGGGEDNPGGSGNWFTELITGIPTLLKALIDGLAGIVDSIAGFLETLVESIVGLFDKLFVPSEESRNNLEEKVNEKFSFIDTSHGEITNISERLETMGGTAPTITIPLSKTPLSKYGIGDYVMTFDWFEPYRYGFHTLLSSIMWIMFIFNQYFALKNILQGTGSFASSLDEPEPEHHRAGFDLW